MQRGAVGAMAVVILVALPGCGDADEPTARQSSASAGDAIELTVLYDDGSGRKTSGTLTCRGADRRAAGALAGRASGAELCAQARGISDLLTSEPDKGRACTQVYGGPETAVVTGTIDGDKVDRRFTRTNGCELADYKRAAGLLQP
ncbi:MAG: hypothetical protein AVDCRST_MAG67-2871 [uncultured Solirubrobacteraceae bacterium]|uniref:Subtilisin inhibitor domain-containing protein n=1 Tax=uncultured Solirubrobacteraceae bacterium TaxID=1162706 RepID=A0A6J4T3Y8_9ACTN|nr:MAG: hypothetical protein AVDCRST_MAG67-2871 [uncultured Solirubrobacteraceae bacterium]